MYPGHKVPLRNAAVKDVFRPDVILIHLLTKSLRFS